MCGIAGYIGSANLPKARLDACLGRMRRRGPDHAGVRQFTTAAGLNVYLLHSRLSIIDLDPRANQPLGRDGWWIVFNGELYNYIEVRRTLPAGIELSTQSDTEVLLQKLRADGIRGLDDCEGMWAFAAYDSTRGMTYLSRDRFGEKPLYLYRDGTGLYFGSEVKFIAALLGHSPRVNYAHLYRYLIYGYKSLYKVSETFFESVSELPRASVLILGPDGQETRETYWQPDCREDSGLSYKEAVQGVRDRLIESVRLRLRADVPLAFCMSGGIDSNSLIAIARRVFRHDVHGFTVVNEDTRYEENDLVEHAVRELGIRHTPIPISTANFLENLRTLIRYHDAPVYTISYYVHWLLMAEVAAHGYRISISGTAADELLTGYYDHHNLYLYEVRNTPLFEPSLKSWQLHTAKFVRNPWLQDPRLYFDNPNFRDHIYLNSEEFARYLKIDWREDFTETRYAASLLRNRMLNELFHEAVPVILHEDDLNAMYYSIENRSPYLDRQLFEWCYRIPTPYLMRDGFSKVVLRDAMQGIVPDRILWNHRKVGFNAPVFSFFDPHDSKVRAWLLDNGRIYEHIRRDRIETLVDEKSLPNSKSKFLFYFLNAKMFLEEFDA